MEHSFDPSRPGEYVFEEESWPLTVSEDVGNETGDPTSIKNYKKVEGKS